MNALLYIHWNPDPEMFRIFGFSVRYYGMLWALGLFLAYVIVRYQYRDRNIPYKTFEPLFLYCFVSILIGSRLGHCLFYDPDVYLTSWRGIVEMILPIQFAPGGGWHFTGYQGLASHGGTVGLIVGLALYCHKYKVHYMDVLDMVAIGTPSAAFCIRMANLMNSEIIGKPTDVPWAFVFERVDALPRHPGQLYEAIAYLALQFIMFYLYKKFRPILRRGFYFGFCLTYIFTARFFIEFVKENQEAFEDHMFINMGQLLSIPFILAGIYCMCFYGRKRRGKA